MTFTRGEKIYILITFALGAFIFLLTLPTSKVPMQQQWQIQSIDTMKYSRDMARQNSSTMPQYADDIEKQVADIADTGANYVAIDTPYDDEFLPVLKLWVRAARLHGLHVWFRGNFSGWEGWFGYASIDEQTHTKKTKQFILNNKDLFQDGDIFSSCPECENGGIKPNVGNPQDVQNYRAFLISDYQTTKEAFASINKNVASNYYSMNADVAKAVMDRETTSRLDGIVVIDHYVPTPTQLADDVSAIATQTGGEVVLGEFGAPIPDIHGNMTDNQQKNWIDESLQKLAGVQNLKGINYWVNKGGSTALWRQDGTSKPAVNTLKKYFTKTN